jgi:hypothetical protein
MIRVVEPHGHEIADAPGAGSNPRRAAHGGKTIGFDLGEPRQRARRERLAVDVGDDFAEVAQPAGCVDEPRLFLARLAISYQIHEPSNLEPLDNSKSTSL